MWIPLNPEVRQFLLLLRPLIYSCLVKGGSGWKEAVNSFRKRKEFGDGRFHTLNIASSHVSLYPYPIHYINLWGALVWGSLLWLYLMGVLCDPKQPLETGTVGEDSSALRVSFGINQVVWELCYPGFGWNDSKSTSVKLCFFGGHSSNPRHPNTSWEDIWTPKTYSGGTWMSGEGFLNYTEIWSASLSGLTLSRFCRAAGFLRPYLRLSSYSVHRAAKDGMLELKLPLTTMTMRYVCRMCTCMYMRVEQKVLNRGLHCEGPGVCSY